jgi:hypothetical protein
MSVGNTKYGDGALQKNVKGSNNSAFGICSSRDTDISWNTSLGAYANMSNISGISNVAVGTNAHLSDVSGSYNTALGTATLLKNKANSNTAVGSNAMENNLTGKENVAVGVQAGYENITGEKNIFIGSYAGFKNIDGSENIFLGNNAGVGSTINYKNIFLGANTSNPFNCTNSTAIGCDVSMQMSDGITIGKGSDDVLIQGTGYLTDLNSSNKIATQGYVQLFASTGIVLTSPCQYATTDNIDLTNPTSTSDIDGTQVNQFLDGSRVLVRCQQPQPIDWKTNDSTSSSFNGIYVYHYNSNFDSSFTRASDCSIGGDPVLGQTTFIKGGDLNKGGLFKQTSDPAVVGTDPLKYELLTTLQFSLGNGLELVGNQLNVKSNLTTQNGNPFLQNIQILGTLDVSDNVSFNNDLLVGGDASFNSKVDVSGTLNVLNSDSYVQNIRIGRGNNNNSTNTVFGKNAGSTLNTDCSHNTFIGYESGFSDVSGNFNTFVGYHSGRNAKTNDNVGVGSYCLRSLTSGNDNTALGYYSGQAITSGGSNTFIGKASGSNTTTGSNNCFMGDGSGFNNLSGNNNTFIGTSSGFYSKGSNNTLIGDNTDASGNIDNSIAIGFEVKVDTSNTIVIGRDTETTKIPGKLNVLLDASFNSNVNISGNLTVKNGSVKYSTKYYTSTQTLTENSSYSHTFNGSSATCTLPSITNNNVGLQFLITNVNANNLIVSSSSYPIYSSISPNSVSPRILAQYNSHIFTAIQIGSSTYGWSMV